MNNFYEQLFSPDNYGHAMMDIIRNRCGVCFHKPGVIPVKTKTNNIKKNKIKRFVKYLQENIEWREPKGFIVYENKKFPKNRIIGKYNKYTICLYKAFDWGFYIKKDGNIIKEVEPSEIKNSRSIDGAKLMALNSIAEFEIPIKDISLIID